MEQGSFFRSQEEKDMMHHIMAEQIAYICAKEEEERMREETLNKKGQEFYEG